MSEPVIYPTGHCRFFHKWSGWGKPFRTVGAYDYQRKQCYRCHMVKERQF